MLPPHQRQDLLVRTYLIKYLNYFITIHTYVRIYGHVGMWHSYTAGIF